MASHASKEIIVAATHLDPPVDGMCWSFHLVNSSDEPVESVVLEEVSYEWGGAGGGSSPHARFGPVPPGAAAEIWRDDDSAAEVRMDLRIVMHGPAGPRTIVAEFPKLYRVRTFSQIPVLEREGVLAWISPSAPG